MANEERVLTDEEMKYISNDIIAFKQAALRVLWFKHFDIIKSQFLNEMVKYVSDDTYKISWEVLRVFDEYAKKHFESLTE